MVVGKGGGGKGPLFRRSRRGFIKNSLFPIVIAEKRRKGHPVQVYRVLVLHVWTGKWTCAKSRCGSDTAYFCL